jgi:hypothetical protein
MRFPDAPCLAPEAFVMESSAGGPADPVRSVSFAVEMTRRVLHSRYGGRR